MGDDFNFFLPDTLLEDSDSDGEGNGDASVSDLPEGFLPTSGAPDFDTGGGYPAQSRLLPGIASANLGSGGSHRCVSSGSFLPAHPHSFPPVSCSVSLSLHCPQNPCANRG